jgi:AraC-like DNA-binding protein
MGEFTGVLGRHIQLGGISVGLVEAGGPFVLGRTPTTVRHYHLTLLLEGSAVVTDGGRDTVLRPGVFHCADWIRPCELRGTGPVRAVRVELPEELLPLPREEAERAPGRRLPGRDGAGALLARFLTELTEHTGTYQPADGPRLGTVLGTMAAALFTHAPESAGSVPPEAPGRALALRIAAFIRRRLADPELTPRAIAAANGISLSYLHRLFQDESDTVAAFIRRQRLERARFDLADPAQGGVPVHAIAARWGFARATDFTRAFRAAYGIPPTDYRRHACAPSGRIAT